MNEKWIALILLFANLVLAGVFYWMQSQSSAQAGQNAPLNSSKIVLQSARILNNDLQASSVAPLSATGEQICVEWRGMSENDLERSRDAVKKLAAKRVLSVEELPVDRMYWVIFPPLPSEAAAKLKTEEFTSLKVKEALIIKDGIWKNGISLGVFGQDNAARSHLRELEKKGVSGLRIETRAKQGTSYYYVVKSEDATTLRELDEIRQGFPATTLVRVACKK